MANKHELATSNWQGEERRQTSQGGVPCMLHDISMRMMSEALERGAAHMTKTDDNIQKILELTQQLRTDMLLSKNKIDGMEKAVEIFGTKLSTIEDAFEVRLKKVEDDTWFSRWLTKIRNRGAIWLIVAFFVAFFIILIIHIGDEAFQMLVKRITG